MLATSSSHTSLVSLVPGRRWSSFTGGRLSVDCITGTYFQSRAPLQCPINNPTCTLLLTSQRYLLLATASSMGAVAIWSMHFIGDRAIQMASGQANYQIEYNPGYTAGSFFLPICVVGAAFYFFSTTEKVSVFATLLGGVLTGAAICGMHYMGQGSISNYVPVYMWGYVLGSALISVAASTAALSIFFYLKSTWTNSWIKRMACASLLATSVSGMHWVAAVGTAYRLKGGAESPNNGLSRQATVIVVLCLVREGRPCICSLRAKAFRRHLDVVLPSSSWLSLGDGQRNWQPIELSKLYWHALPSTWTGKSWSLTKDCCRAGKSPTLTAKHVSTVILLLRCIADHPCSVF